MSDSGHDGCLEGRKRLEWRIAGLESANKSLEQAALALSRTVADERLKSEQLEVALDANRRERFRLSSSRRDFIVLAKSLGATSDQLMDLLGMPHDGTGQ